jgi:hypothetical protein
MRVFFSADKSPNHEYKMTFDYYRHVNVTAWKAFSVVLTLGNRFYYIDVVLWGVKAYMEDQRMWKDIG